MPHVPPSGSATDGSPSPVASFSSLEENEELISTDSDLTIVKGIATYLYRLQLYNIKIN